MGVSAIATQSGSGESLLAHRIIHCRVNWLSYKRFFGRSSHAKGGSASGTTSE